MRARLNLAGLALVLATGAAAQQPDAPATTKAAAAAGEEAATRRPAAATVEAARMAEMLAQVPVSGTLVARQEVQVYPQVSGYEIEQIVVEAGDTVKAGDVLARLSDATLSAQLAQADAELQRAEAALKQARSQIASGEATLNQATAALDRAQRLQQSGNVSQASLDQAIAAEASARAAAASSADAVAVTQAQVAQAEAARGLAQLDLDRTAIKAPVGGVVSARTARLGAIASSGGDPLFTLIADGEIEVAGEVIETALDQLNAGDPAEMRVAGVGAVPGSVRLVPASVDPVTRLGIVRVQLQSSPALRVGLFASGWITTEQRMALTVPATAVISSNTGEAGAEIVQVVRDNRVETRPVTAGLLWNGRREIRAGLNEGELVLARAAAFFRNGDPVDPVPVPPETAQAGTPAAAATAPIPVAATQATSAPTVATSDSAPAATSPAAPAGRATPVPSAPATPAQSAAGTLAPGQAAAGTRP